MARIVFLIFLLPATAFTQNITEDWVTPVANVEFGDSLIIYSYSLDNCITFERIKPVDYDGRLLQLKGVLGTGCINDYKDMFNQVYEYLEGWGRYINKASNRDKTNFLKATTLLILWNERTDKEYLPPGTLTVIRQLTKDMFIDTARSAGLVLKLYDFYNE